MMLGSTLISRSYDVTRLLQGFKITENQSLPIIRLVETRLLAIRDQSSLNNAYHSSFNLPIDILDIMMLQIIKDLEHCWTNINPLRLFISC